MRATSAPYVVLVDVDVILPEGALAELLAELEAGGYSALAAGQHSTSGPATGVAR